MVKGKSLFSTVVIFLLLRLNGFCSAQFYEPENVDEGGDEVKDLLEGEIGEVKFIVYSDNTSITTPVVDYSDEEWVRTAVLDVAYYLRAHKFNDFDRRYYKDTGIQEGLEYKEFPNPPLRYLHWEVYKYCDKGFYQCLDYLHETVLKAALVRTQDTSVMMNERRWEYSRNAKSIDKHYKECLRLKEIDWRDADPFKGPLERFQWRVSASYYMCSFTMQDFSPLVMFGERCDNFANCLEGKSSFNNDPRADDSKPYKCAMYSFCPDTCCPQKKIQDMDECLDLNENPCHWHSERSKRLCSLKREQNVDLASMALNQWNLSCICEVGYVWESVFNACVDIDECYTGKHQCTSVQSCINLQGHYACVCAWGYINVSGSCEPNNLLTTVLGVLHHHHHPTPAPPSRPQSIIGSLLRFTSSLFHEQVAKYMHKLFSQSRLEAREKQVMNEEE